MSFTIYNQKLAGYLMLNGELLVAIKANDKFPGKNVYYFRYSDSIQNTIKEWKKATKGVKQNNGNETICSRFNRR